MSVHDDRNPLLLPAVQPSRLKGCPACKHPDYNGRNVQGVITFTCAKCQNKWHGGLPQEPQDQTIPLPPVDPRDRPTVDFVRGPHGETLEVRRGVSTTPEFRKGAPIPSGEE